MTDNEALKNQIKSQGIPMTHVANVLNITREALYVKLSGKTELVDCKMKLNNKK